MRRLCLWASSILLCAAGHGRALKERPHPDPLPLTGDPPHRVHGSCGIAALLVRATHDDKRFDMLLRAMQISSQRFGETLDKQRASGALQKQVGHMCTSSPRIIETALFADEQSDSMLRKKLGKSDSPWDSVILTDRRSPHRNDSLEDRLFPQGCPACLPKVPHFHWPARALLLKVAAWEGALRAQALARVSRARARRRPHPPQQRPRNNAAAHLWRVRVQARGAAECSRAAGSPPACSAGSRRAPTWSSRWSARRAEVRARAGPPRARARASPGGVVEPSARVARRVALRQVRRTIRSSASTTASTRARRTPSSKPSASATSARSHCASAPTGARRRRKGSSGARRPSTSSTSRRRSRSRTSSSRIVTCSSRRRRPTPSKRSWSGRSGAAKRTSSARSTSATASAACSTRSAIWNPRASTAGWGLAVEDDKPSHGAQL